MIVFLGVFVLLVLWGAVTAFAKADVSTLKVFFRWVLALGAIVLAVGLVLTGREGLAIFALTMLGPSLWTWWRGGRATVRAPAARGAMTRADAYEVLGLRPGCSAEEIKAAHLRLMRAAHPDAGGSDWLASRVNQARDILLG